jgi:hypothetical protein
LPVRKIAAQLEQLPVPANAVHPTPQLSTLNSHLALPPARELVSNTNRMLIASADANHKSGVVLDYDEIDSGETDDVIFEAGTTYFINGDVIIDTTATFEGGTVIKCADGGAGFIEFTGTSDSTAVWETDPYHPAIFTSMDDNSVGETIAGSSGSPATPPDNQNYYLWLQGDFDDDPYNPLPVVMNACFYYADIGVAAVPGCSMMNCQFFKCDFGVVIYDACEGEAAYLQNVLFSQCGAAISDLVQCSSGCTLYAQNITMDQCSALFDEYPGFDGSLLAYVTNSIFADTPQIEDADSTVTGLDNGFYNSPEFGGNPMTNTAAPFQTGVAGGYYLPPDSPFIDAGSATADTAGLYYFTTQTNQTIEGVSTVDLGWHYPAVDADGNPVDTEVSGTPDYLEDSDGDGLPDAWETNYFGNLNQTGSSLDSSGNTLLYDYENGVDPNPISFTIEVANNYVNTTNASVQLNVTGGVPGYCAVSVDDTNFAADASWTAFASTNLTVSLGTNEGWHDIWIGLRGYADATNAAVWQWKRLKLDRTPPQLTVTSPTTTTVNVPMLQLTGYSLEALDHISCDLTNALGLATNLDAGVTDQYYDTNTFEFTTNYFECLDIPLTNGVNKIIIHATDLAGNVTVTNFSFTLDYSGATNPAVTLYWPTDGTLICNSNYTWRGHVDDPTASVTARLVDTNGNTNIFNAIVERDGNFWVENLPLAAGTNFLRLTVTNAAGLVTVTNLMVFPGAVGLTIAMPDSSQLWNQGLTVSGTISDSGDYTVWVNGVKASYTDATDWTATNVYLPDGGTALIQARAIPNSNNGGNGTGGSGGGPVSYGNLGNPDPPADNDAESQVDKPAEIYVETYNVPNVHEKRHADYEYTALGESNIYDAELNYTLNWSHASGGGSTAVSTSVSSGNMPGVSMFNDWANVVYQWPAQGEGTSEEDYIDTEGGVTDSGSITDPADPPFLPLWHINVQAQNNYTTILTDVDLTHTEQMEYKQNEDTKMTLKTGGKDGSSKMNLFCISASAEGWRVSIESGGGGSPVLADTADTGAIDPTTITIDGKALDSSGNMYEVLADNTTRDVTPTVTGNDYYTFTVGESKQCAPMRLNFSDNPWVPPDWFTNSGYSGYFTLQAVCRTGWGTNDWYPLATFSWGYDVDTSGLQHPHPYATNSGCGTIIVDSFSDYYTNSGTCPGVSIKAHYIGCCDGGELNWIQSYTDFHNGIQATTNAPDPDPDSPPYYFGPGSGYGKIGYYLSDYTDIEDWINGSCP